MVKSEDSTCEGFYVNHKDVEKIASGMVPEETVTMMAETFRILGDPTRLRLVQALSKGELCVCDMAVMLGVGRTSISNHLRLLRGMRLVKYRREGKLAYYSLADDHISGLVAECLDHVQKL
ncbi:MAG: metalloregulator ArsR/SmtB family transcription factor [Thermodesulfobacteriota bacterium]|nr:MAG: metalloregulator ArsR/SmtB family transcription factor [Thermodesulfobacteriota bacterium]